MSPRYILQIKKVPNEDFTTLEPEFKIVCLDAMTDEESHIFYSEILPNAEGIIATGPVTSELIAKALKLKVIVVNGAGYDDIDVSAASAVHVPVYNIPDVTANATAEIALGLMLSVSRRINELNFKLRSDPQHVPDYFRIGINPGHSLSGKNLGIIGVGNIGSKLAKMAAAMNMHVLYTQRQRIPLLKEGTLQYLPFDELLAASDIVSINCPLNDSTRGMFDEKAFMRMKTGSILINTARGEIVDQKELVRFLKSGKLLGAGLDVFPNNDQVDPELLEMPNVVVTPHIGTNTYETRQEMAAHMTAIVRAVCNGESEIPGNLVNPESQRASRTE